MNVTVAAYQMKIVPFNLQKNAEKIEKAFKKSHDRKVHFLVLPEECWVGPGYQEKNKNEISNFVKDFVPRLCKKYHMYCIAGSFIEQSDTPNHAHNISYLFDMKGDIVGSYAKRHLVPHVETEAIPGTTHKVFDTEFGKIGIQICRDILYPEATKVMADKGAKIIFSPAFWSKFSTDFPSVISKYHVNDELQAIKHLVPARSIENEVIFVFANAADTFNVNARKDTLLGYTQICQPFAGPIELYAHNREHLMIQSINTDIVDEMRKGWRIRGH